MTPIQQLFLGTGSAVATKPYIDDVFSTFLYTGNATARSINTGVDMSKGGMTWIKSRSHSLNGNIFSSNLVDGNGTYGCLQTTDTDAAGYSNTGSNAMLTAFNNNGFSLGADGSTYRVNGGTLSGSVPTYSSWSFRKSSAFTTCTWTGNGVAGRQISHDLSSIPGCIIVKCTTESRNWAVYHRGMGNGKAMALDTTDAQHDSTTYWNDTDPTASVFTVGTANDTNKNGETYVAYVFAGGEEQGNASVDFSGTDDRLTWDSNSDVNFGTGDFTVEFWLRKPDGGATHTGFFQISGTGGGLTTSYGSSLALGWHGSGYWQLYRGGNFTNGPSFTPTANQWYHAAVVRSSGTTKVYIDGTEVISLSDTHDYNYNNLVVGGYYNTSYLMKGQISNFRITKGQALYTSSFTPTTSPLTTTSQSATASNVKLLCCNDIGASGNTKSPVPLTLTGSPQGSTVSPFAASTATDASAVFGPNEDKSVIKCGSYIGNGSSTGPEINLGFEPQWVMTKKSSASGGDWVIWDSMRGIVTGGDDPRLKANENEAEGANNAIDLTSTGFKIVNTAGNWNANGETMIYMCIRRPDGYVGKPPSLGTDVFAMDTGNGSSTIPAFDSGFVVDMAIARRPAITDDWREFDRLRGSRYLEPNNTDQHTSPSTWVHWDSNVGVGTNFTSSYQSWMWKRGAGFTMVAYDGNGADRYINHNLNKIPEMVWFKRRDSTYDWGVYHKGLNGGTNPHDYFLQLNTNVAEVSSSSLVLKAAPTSTAFKVGNSQYTNVNNGEYIAMLFASVKGISHCGTFTGNGSTQTITIPDGGFQPRFLIMKCTSHAVDWQVLDTTRGWGSGNDKYLELNTNAAQYTTIDFGAPTSTGFTLTENAGFNGSGREYIYYAHA